MVSTHGINRWYHLCDRPMVPAALAHAACVHPAGGISPLSLTDAQFGVQLSQSEEGTNKPPGKRVAGAQPSAAIAGSSSAI